MEPRNNSTKQIIIIGVIALALLIVIFLVISRVHKNNSITNLPSGHTAVNMSFPAAANSVVTMYIQAREDSLGADQTSPDSWLTTVKPITTAAWFASLQPSTNSSTGNVPSDYYVAQNNGFVIKADVSNCSWDQELAKPTNTSGVVLCSLTDNTVYKSSGTIVPASSLPFGWTYSGVQTSPVLGLINQDNSWLVSNDSTGQGQ